MSDFGDDDDEIEKMQNEIYKKLQIKGIEKGKGKGKATGESSKRIKGDEREEEEEKEEKQPVMTSEEYKVMENIDWIKNTDLNMDVKQLTLNVSNLTIDETDIPLFSSELRVVFIYIQKERRIKVLLENMSIKNANFSTVSFPTGVVGLFGGRNFTKKKSYTKCYYFVPSSLEFIPFNNKMIVRRSGSAAVLLKDGRVLIIGGFDVRSGVCLGSCEIYDPKTQEFTLLYREMHEKRHEAAAVLMRDGTVLIFGGCGAPYQPVRTVERYDPVSNTFSLVGQMRRNRFAHSATLLLNGKILICGGIGENNTEIYDPTTNWSFKGPSMQRRRSTHSASLIIRPKTDEIITRKFASKLNDYEVLLFGGDSDKERLTCEIYDPVKNDFYDGPEVPFLP